MLSAKAFRDSSPGVASMLFSVAVLFAAAGATGDMNFDVRSAASLPGPCGGGAAVPVGRRGVLHVLGGELDWQSGERRRAGAFCR